MKKISIILALLFFAFSIEAQTVEKSKRTKERKTTTSSSTKSEKPAKTKVVKAPAVSKTSSSRSSSRTNVVKPTNPTKTSVSRATNSPRTYTTDKKRNQASSTSTTRSSAERNHTVSNTQTRKTGNRSTVSKPNSNTVSSRTLNSTSVKNNSRGNASRVVNAPRNYNTQSNGRKYTPRTSERDAASRRTFVINKPSRVNRVAPKVHYNYQSIDYRRTHKPYIAPRLANIIWNATMYRNYRSWYPEFNLWYYPYGYRIHTISAYDSYNYIGEIARVYGRVSEVWYSGESNEYYLYIGGPYPYQDFTIILEARDARRFSWDPIRFFTNRNVTSTGLVSLFEDKPEMQIRKRSQISLY